METTRRVPEFKFIRWQGGAEVIRQNALFKDFYLLAEQPSAKRKCLYVLGTKHPLKFFKSGRSLSGVLSRNVALQKQFHAKFGDQFRTVREYYRSCKDSVVVQDMSPWVPGLVEGAVEVDEAMV